MDVPATRATSVMRVAGNPRSTIARHAASRIASLRAGWRASWPGGRPGRRGGEVGGVRVDTAPRLYLTRRSKNCAAAPPRGAAPRGAKRGGGGRRAGAGRVYATAGARTGASAKS